MPYRTSKNVFSLLKGSQEKDPHLLTFSRLDVVLETASTLLLRKKRKKKVVSLVSLHATEEPYQEINFSLCQIANSLSRQFLILPVANNLLICSAFTDWLQPFLSIFLWIKIDIMFSFYFFPFISNVGCCSYS